MLGPLKTLYRGRGAALALLKQKLTGRRIPVRVSFLVTKRCNLRCFYCYAMDVIENKALQEPSLADLTGILDQIHAAGCRWINILGGEPLIRKDIDQFIDYARAKGFFLELTTNGFYVRQHIEALRQLDHLCISLDGNKEANDKGRGKDSFEKIVDAIEFAVAEGLSVRVHATLCRRTMAQESLTFLAGFCNRLGVRLNYSENGLPGIEQMDPDFLLSEEETMAFYRSYKDLKKRGLPIVSSDVAVAYADKWPLPDRTTLYQKDLPQVPADSYYPCQLGRNQCFISADGNVYPCTKKWGEGKNLYEVGFQAAWDHLADLDCVACKELGTIEQSVILGLQPRAVLNGLLNFG
ncbi:MAG: radical SAM protein [Magnetococcales bacterium]|nr:radical SAM protein [Magnetococcales bacterium]